MFENELKPSTVTQECFEIYDSQTDKEIDIKEVVYNPLAKQVVIAIEPNYLYGLSCEVKINNSLVYMDGSTAQATAVTTELMPEYACDLYEVSVKRIKLYGEFEAIAHPNPYEDFVAKVTVINASKEQQTKRMRIYKNDEVNLPLVDTIITIEADSTAEFVYSIDGVDWDTNDVINTKIS